MEQLHEAGAANCGLHPLALRASADVATSRWPRSWHGNASLLPPQFGADGSAPVRVAAPSQRLACLAENRYLVSGADLCGQAQATLLAPGLVQNAYCSNSARAELRGSVSNGARVRLPVFRAHRRAEGRGPRTVDPGPGTRDPGPWTRDPGPKTQDPTQSRPECARRLEEKNPR